MHVIVSTDSRSYCIRTSRPRLSDSDSANVRARAARVSEGLGPVEMSGSSLAELPDLPRTSFLEESMNTTVHVTVVLLRDVAS